MSTLREKTRIVAKILGVMVLIQLALFLLNQCQFLLFERTDFTDRMASMVSMILISSAFIGVMKKANTELSVLPVRFGPWYIIATVGFAIVFLAMPSIYSEGIGTFLVLVYGSIVTPFFEEIVFRGYVWEKLNKVFSKEWQTYIINTMLFGLWHLGYISSIAFRVDDCLANIMFWKVITGICFGLVLGALRIKTKNCYSTMLLHGLMNIFAR